MKHEDNMKKRLLIKMPRIEVAVIIMVIGAIGVGLGLHDSATNTRAGNQAATGMLDAKSADAFTAKAAALPQTGWTATASDSQAAYPAYQAIDGNTATYWHSQYNPTLVPLPHSLTIDMHATKGISGLEYQPRTDTLLNGNIGRYSITTSTDGVTWSAPVATGTWNDDHVKKTVNFTPVVVRYVRLTALTEAGNRGAWSSVAELNLLGGVPADPALPRNGWVASSYDAQGTNVPANVLDGNGATIWHSEYTPVLKPLPHTLAITMPANTTVTGLKYLPRQDATLNGNIGQFNVLTSTDAVNWVTAASGTWADDKTEKTVTFAAKTARYVRLVALTEAGNRGAWTSAAEVNLLGPGAAPGLAGSWSAPIGIPLVPVSAVALPNNKLLTFAAYDPLAYNHTSVVTKVAITDLATNITGQTATVDTTHEMFCTGLAIMADGRVLINGGSTDGATTIYNPTTNTWTKGPLMNLPRAYESTTALSDGRVFTLGGSWNDSAGGKDGEVYSPVSNTWTRLTGVTAAPILTADPQGVYRSDNHAWLFAGTGGSVFQAGPSKNMNWITTSGAGTINSAGTRADSADAMNGNAVMYDIGKILTLGGAPAYQDSQATRRAYTVDISGGITQPVVTKRVGDLNYARAFVNSVVLPDGKVLAFGGQQYAQPFTDTGAATVPELWDPVTGNFSLMNADVTPRTYHSIALLLADGRVFSGGGGLCGACTTNHTDGRIFTPPYLLNANGTLRARPAITSAPATAVPGSTISVTTSAATPSFALVRASSVTHSVNTDQRRIPLTPSAPNGTTYTLNIPSDRGVVLPGSYMLFALDANGTPSVAKFININ
jgi:galactose oxidase